MSIPAYLEPETVISDNALNYGILSDPEDDQFIDLVEMGLSREVISDELYYPVHKARGWIRCYVTICGSAAEGGMDYRMYLEGSNRFLLSAKQLDNDVILISSDEDFPLSGIDGRARIGYGATAIRQEDSTILVTTNHCHLCDNLLGRHTCGRGENREIVARVVHSTQRHRQADAEMRIVSVQFPYISRASPEAMREGRRTWCPRTLLGTGPASMPLDTTAIERIKHHPNNVRCVNKLPVWNEAEDSLMLHFQANRVLSTSVCNFLLYEERKLLARKQQPPPLPGMGSGGVYPSSTAVAAAAAGGGGGGGRGPVRMSQIQQEQQRRASIARGASGALMASPGKLTAAPPAVHGGDQIAIPADQALLQFGRVDSQKFILDFKYPLSPLQAFGISICSFAFEGIKKKKTKKKSTDGRPDGPAPPPPRSPLGRMIQRSDSITSLRSGYDSDASDSSVSSRISTASRDSFSSQSSLVSNLSYLSTASRYSTSSSASSGGQSGHSNAFLVEHQGQGQGQGLLSELPPHRRDTRTASGDSAGAGTAHTSSDYSSTSVSDAAALSRQALQVLNAGDAADEQNEI
jgi:hypothetical protein